MAVRRFDRGELKKPVRMPNGFLRVDAYLTRCGVFEYRNPDGTLRRELRLPEEVFNADSLKSFEGVPVTDEHPPEPLTAKNAKKYSAGSVLAPRQDTTFVASPLMVHDADLAKKLDSGHAQEVSCGYTCDLEESAGVTEAGELYDFIQRNIRGNHVAIVPFGRAGSEVRVRMDATDAFQVSAEPSGRPNPGAAAPPNEERPFMAQKIHIDGVEYPGDEQLSQAVGKLQRQHQDALKSVGDLLATTKAELEKTKAKADALAEDLKKAEQARKDAEDPKRVRALIDARVALERQCLKHLDEADKKAVAKMGDKDLKLAVLKKLAPSFSADGRTDDYVQARFDHAIENASEHEDDVDDVDDDAREDDDDVSVADVRRAADRAGRSDKADRFDAEAARQRMLKKNQNAWKPRESKA